MILILSTTGAFKTAPCHHEQTDEFGDRAPSASDVLVDQGTPAWNASRMFWNSFRRGLFATTSYRYPKYQVYFEVYYYGIYIKNAGVVVLLFAAIDNSDYKKSTHIVACGYQRFLRGRVDVGGMVLLRPFLFRLVRSLWHNFSCPSSWQHVRLRSRR